jgi:hypothetical protein
VEEEGSRRRPVLREELRARARSSGGPQVRARKSSADLQRHREELTPARFNAARTTFSTRPNFLAA